MKSKSFIDQVEVLVRSGKGGDGSASFRREALVEFGGPDGGDGGRGGDVVFKASEHVNSLLTLFYDPKCVAQDGGAGKGQKMFGKRGKDLVVPVPLGTEVYEGFRKAPAARLPRECPTEILCRRSWTKPKGQSQPQTNRPNNAPNSIKNPRT
ncbi:MAG: hypothetical protein IIW14_03905 [Kiritimatiellae bacterium]|nr:hypothetical protein [Kiritimatiellia bacterium]